LTPYFTIAELERAGVKLVLYPLSAFRAMSRAAEQVYATIRKQGTQRAVLDIMQTRDELYSVLDYHAYERKLDELFANSGAKRNSMKRSSATRSSGKRSGAKRKRPKRRVT